jgi:hypothetical protein
MFNFCLYAPPGIYPSQSFHRFYHFMSMYPPDCGLCKCGHNPDRFYRTREEKTSMVVRKDPTDLNVELSVLSAYALKGGPCLSRKGLVYFTDNSLGVCSM